MDDKDLFGKSSSDAFGFGGGSSLPDPAASPSTYDSDFLNGSSTSLGGLDSIPDPAASPDSYQDFDIPDINSDFDVPSVDEVAMPEPAVIPPPSAVQASDPVIIPRPAAVPQSAVIPQPVLPQQPKDFDFSSDDTPMPSVDAAKPADPIPQPVTSEDDPAAFSGHYSWNGSGYVESEKPTVRPSVPARRQESSNSSDPPPASSRSSSFFGGGSNADAIKSVKTMGILSIVFSVISCGCSFLGIVFSVIGLSIASKLGKNGTTLTDEEQKNLKSGRTLCLIGIIITIATFLLSFMGGTILTFI